MQPEDSLSVLAVLTLTSMPSTVQTIDSDLTQRVWLCSGNGGISSPALVAVGIV